MFEISELTFLRLTLLICAPTIVLLAFLPITWMISSFCNAFKGDPTSPSFIVSYLWRESKWYVSIVRYGQKFAGDKQTIMSRKHSWLTLAVIGLIIQWLKYWWPNIVRPKMKNIRNRIAIRFAKPGSEIEIKEKAVLEYNFDLFLSKYQWNATQKMFISNLKHNSLKHGPIANPVDLEHDPYNRIGDVYKLFFASDRHKLYRLAGCTISQINDHECRRAGRKENLKSAIDSVVADTANNHRLL